MAKRVAKNSGRKTSGNTRNTRSSGSAQSRSTSARASSGTRASSRTSGARVTGRRRTTGTASSRTSSVRATGRRRTTGAASSRTISVRATGRRRTTGSASSRRQSTGRASATIRARRSGSAQAQSRARRQRIRQVQSASGRAGGGAAYPLVNHEEIREWAEVRGAVPTCVRGTGSRGRGDTGMIRLEFPRFGEEPKLQPISWDRWFEKFDDSGLALMVQEERAIGDRSNFNKLVKRATALAKAKPRVRAAR